jgi:hypothetical protein
MSQSTVVYLILLAVLASMFGYMVGKDDRERSRLSQQVEQTSQQNQGETK